MSGVRVNECRVFATTRGADWWTDYRHQFGGIDRIRVITASLAGDMVEVACDDEEHARWLAAHMEAQGIPSSAVAVVRSARFEGIGA